MLVYCFFVVEKSVYIGFIVMFIKGDMNSLRNGLVGVGMVVGWYDFVF